MRVSPPNYSSVFGLSYSGLKGWRLAGFPLLVVAALCTMFAVPLEAKKVGGFPGRGSYQAWVKACKPFDEGQDLRTAGRYLEAAKKYEEAIKLYPFDADFFHALGIAQGKGRQFKLAENSCRRAIELDGSVAEYWSALGQALYAQGRYEEAKAAWSRALLLNPPPELRQSILSGVDEIEKRLRAGIGANQP